MKQLSSMIVGIRLQRLQHAADADAAGQVHVLADLRARADGRPRVDHRAFVDIGADVDERRHQHDVARDEGAAPRDGRRDDAHAGRREVGVGILRELGLHLVVEAKRHVGTGQSDPRVVGETERQQHRLLDPLMRDPFAAHLFRDAQPPGVEVREHVVDGVADGGRRRGRRQRCALFPRGIDRGGKRLIHSSFRVRDSRKGAILPQRLPAHGVPHRRISRMLHAQA